VAMPLPCTVLAPASQAFSKAFMFSIVQLRISLKSLWYFGVSRTFPDCPAGPQQPLRPNSETKDQRTTNSVWSAVERAERDVKKAVSDGCWRDETNIYHGIYD
jgi:hypothetical protein